MKKNPAANVGDLGSIPRSGRSPGEGNGNLPQYSCLGNPRDRGIGRATYSLWSCKGVGYDLATKQLGDSSKNIATKYLEDSSAYVFF